MKFNYLIKVTPFLSTLLIILILSISNQKVNTRLRILIWQTPSLSLGTYLAISSGSGFILSYIFTTSLAKIKLEKPTKTLKFNNIDRDAESNIFTESETNRSYDKTLIERDFNDPLPTVNASFRIIGKTDRIDSNFINNINNIQDNTFIENEEEYDEYSEKNDIMNQSKPSSSDWSDETFSSW